MPSSGFNVRGTINEATGYRIGYVLRSGNIARMIASALAASAANIHSIHYATERGPVYHITNQFLDVLPSGGLRQVLLVAYPTITSASGSSPGFPAEYENGLVLFAAIRARLQQLSATATTLSGLVASLPVAPNLPVAPAYIYTDAVADIIDPTTVAGFTGAPSYSVTLPDFTTELASIVTYLNTEEDIELASAQMTVIRTKLENFGVTMQDALNTFNEANIAWQADIQRLVHNADLTQARLTAQTQLKTNVVQQNRLQQVQTDIAEYRDELARYAQAVQSYSSQASVSLQSLSTSIQRNVAKHALHVQQLLELKNQWTEFLSLELGITQKESKE